MSIEDFFRPPEVPDNFPLLRLVAARQKDGYLPEFELYRPREVLGFRKAKIVVHFRKDGQPPDYKEDEWDDNLNAGLIQLHVKSRTLEEEKDRFALGLRAAFRTPERRYGDGYFNALLADYVRKTDFREHKEVAPVLEHLVPNESDQSRSYGDCWNMIDAAVKGRAVELIHQLQYDMPTAWDILAGAMARYLDERFSVTNRRLLHLL